MKIRPNYFSILIFSTAALLFTGCVLFSASGNLSSGVIEEPLLWEIGEEPNKSWLFGTVHLGISAEKELPPSVWDKLRRSKCFMMETDISQIDPQQLVSMAKLPDGKRLSKMLSPQLWRKLKTRLAHIIPETFLDESKPWFVILNYIPLLIPNKTKPMDLSFYKAAKEMDKKLLFLEEWKTQMILIEKATSITDLADLIENEEGYLEQNRELYAAYRSGDYSNLSKIFADGSKHMSAEQFKILLDNRNKDWIPKIERAIKNQSCFIAVGAGHMFRKNGLLALLALKNYKIRRTK